MSRQEEIIAAMLQLRAAIGLLESVPMPTQAEYRACPTNIILRVDALNKASLASIEYMEATLPLVMAYTEGGDQ